MCLWISSRRGTVTARRAFLGVAEQRAEPSRNIYRADAGMRQYSGGIWIPFKWGVVLTTCVILIYCTIGGMWGVVLTDAIQTAVIMIGVPILAVATLIKYTATGGSVGEIFTTPFIPKGMGTPVYLSGASFSAVDFSIVRRLCQDPVGQGCQDGIERLSLGRSTRHRRRTSVFCYRRSRPPAVSGRGRRYFHDHCHGGSQSGAGGNCHRGDSFRGHVQCELCYTVSRIIFFQRPV